MDTVQDTTDTKLTDFIKIKDNYLSGYGVIGGDDKCGIYIILEVLKDREMNFAFFVQEEIGGRGSKDWVKDHKLDNVLYGIVLDRMGNSDILCSQNNYGTAMFETFLHEVGKDFGYSPGLGSFSDADNLNDRISCANLSCGYYNAHTKYEFVNLSDLENTYKYVNAVISHVNEKFEKPKQRSWKGKRIYGGYGYGYDYGDDYWFDNKDKDDSSLGITVDDVECIVCKKQTSTIYITCINDFICKRCVVILKDELEEAELNSSLYDLTDEEWVNTE